LDDGAEETLIDWTPADNSSGTQTDNPSSRINAAIQAFAALSTDERDTIVENIGKEETQDFLSAWSIQPWSGGLAQNVYFYRIGSLCQYESLSTPWAKGPKPQHS
jgi:hypothetical protein